MDIVTRPREKLHLCFDSGNLEGWLAARTRQFRFSTFLSVDLFGGEEEEARSHGSMYQGEGSKLRILESQVEAAILLRTLKLCRSRQ